MLTAIDRHFGFRGGESLTLLTLALLALWMLWPHVPHAHAFAIRVCDTFQSIAASVRSNFCS